MHDLEFFEISEIDSSEIEFNDLKSIEIEKAVVICKNDIEFLVMAIHSGNWEFGKWVMVNGRNC